METLKVIGKNKKTVKKVEQFLDKIKFEKFVRRVISEAIFLYDCPVEETPAYKDFIKKHKIK